MTEVVDRDGCGLVDDSVHETEAGDTAAVGEELEFDGF